MKRLFNCLGWALFVVGSLCVLKSSGSTLPGRWLCQQVLTDGEPINSPPPNVLVALEDAAHFSLPVVDIKPLRTSTLLEQHHRHNEQRHPMHFR